MFVKKLKMISIIFTSCFLFLESIVAPLYAFTSPETLQIHGFASQGLVLTSDNRFFGDSEEGSFDFTELGLNASIRPLPDLQLSAQVLSRRAGEGDNGAPRLDYGFLDYSIISDQSRNLGIRLGRVKNPLGFYNDTRDVAFTRPSIILPQSIYFDRTRNLALSADGLHFHADQRTNIGDFFYQLGLVYPDVDDAKTTNVLIANKPGQVEGALSSIGRLIFEREGGRTRIGLSGALVNIRTKSSTTSTEGMIRFRPLILSAQYNAEFWSLTSEYALRYLKYQDVEGFPDFSRTGESFYLQGTYRFLGKLEALLRYDVLYQDRNDRSGNKTTGANPKHSLFAKDWTLGLRWDITNTWMSRIEYHYVDGTAWLSSLDNPSPSKTDRYWDMFSILVSYRF